MSGEELEQRIAQGGMRGAPEGDGSGRLLRIEQLLEKLVRLVTGDAMDPTAPPGMAQRQNAQEKQLADHEMRLIALEEAGKTTTQRALDRAWDIARMVGAAGLGAWIGKGGPH